MKIQVFFLCMCVLHASAFFGGDPRIEPHEEISQVCLNHAASGSCEFYRCMENRFPCGHNGFALNHGLYFCNRMQSRIGSFNEMGQKWLNGTSKCLANGLLPVYNAYASRCGDIKDAAIDSMLTCNARTDSDGTTFCSFVSENSGAYSGFLDLDQIARIVRLRSPRMVASLVSDAGRCGVTQIQSRLESVWAELGNVVTSITTSLRNRWNSIWN